MIIKRARTLIPNLSSLIRVEKTISPVSLQRYTLNRDGSVRGWEAFPSQLRIFQLLERVVQEQIFFVGHWASQYAPGGLFTAIFSAEKVAKAILTKIK
jgi:hypothetical protein